MPPDFDVSILAVGGGKMLQNQEVAMGLSHLAESICNQCPMSETCDELPVCGDIQLLKKAEELLAKV